MGSPNSLGIREAVLQGRSGPILLDAPLFTLGCDSNNRLVLEDANASVYHAVLQQQEDHHAIMDLGSSLGTSLNEQRLEEKTLVALKDGDRLRIGETVYTYKESLSSVSAQTPMKEAKSASEQGTQSPLPGNLPSPTQRSGAYLPLLQQEDPEIRGVSRRTETCEHEKVHLVTHVETTAAGITDSELSAPIHDALAKKDLKPREHFLDAGYADADLVVKSQRDLWIEVIGPMRPDSSWQAKANQGYDNTHFAVDWQTHRVVCPASESSIRAGLRIWMPGALRSSASSFLARIAASALFVLCVPRRRDRPGV